ncbi:MAG: hypothetical protein JWM71_2347, partial [Solirubrobacteraceae bacterium]|nr:hypothetical protein [Solirubrobacteraceae bacterium]
ASRPSTSVATPAVSALRAAGEAVVAVTGLRLGSAVAVFAPRHARAARPTVVLAARDNCGVTVLPTLIFTGGRRRALPAHVHSLARGDAYVVRLRLSASERRAARVRFAIAVTDVTGTVRRATRSVRVAKP